MRHRPFRCDVGNLGQVLALREFVVTELTSNNFAVLSADITQSSGIVDGDGGGRWRSPTCVGSRTVCAHFSIVLRTRPPARPW
jgi:hypothetical protein